MHWIEAALRYLNAKTRDDVSAAEARTGDLEDLSDGQDAGGAEDGHEGGAFDPSADLDDAGDEDPKDQRDPQKNSA